MQMVVVTNTGDQDNKIVVTIFSYAIYPILFHYSFISFRLHRHLYNLKNGLGRREDFVDLFSRKPADGTIKNVRAIRNKSRQIF